MCEVGSFLIEGSNSNYEVKNGALIEKNSKTLVKASKSFTSITNDVLVIGSYAFGSLKFLIWLFQKMLLQYNLMRFLIAE